jgi:hypothetical protein
MDDRDVIDGDCWVAYFDVLGFRDLVLRFDYPEYPHCYGAFVRAIYGHMLESVQKWAYETRLFCAWFSDTFLLYTPVDSYGSFAAIAGSASSACSTLVIRHYPVRGALGTGRLYADRERNIFVGSALINAYEYGEKQDWIGFAITPEANKKFNDRVRARGGVKKTPWTCCDYYEYDVPIKETNGKSSTERLWAANIGQIPYVKTVISDGANSQDPKVKIQKSRSNTRMRSGFWSG